MFYSASWQLLEERFDSDTTDGGGVFAEEKCSQTVWGLRYIDDAVLRRTDTNQDYDYADAGERTDYYLTDPQFSVVAVVDDTAALQERVAYSAYGEARHHYPADMDGDGNVDSGDSSWFSNINNLKDIDEAGYNPDGDLNRDGSVSIADMSLFGNWYGKAALAKGLVSDPDGPNSPIGYDGYVFNAETKLYTVRNRHYEPVAGRWMERDPIGYLDATSLYEYGASSPLVILDPTGLYSLAVGDPPLDDLDYLIDTLEAVGGSPELWNAAHGMQDLVNRVTCHANYLKCLGNCIADDPTKLVNALIAAGWNIGGDYFEAASLLGEVIEVLFTYLSFNPETGSLEPDGISITEQLAKYGSEHAGETCEALADSEEHIMNVVDRWLRQGAANADQGDELLDRLSESRRLTRALNNHRLQRLLSKLSSGAKLAGKVNAYTTAAQAAWDALKSIQEQCGDECDDPCD
ncbi:MAG: hypothetical protein IT431_12805 [Phycisphaerales bacterium]|nr:hypothetical protein [Phycisphaerales bacterium]